MLEQLSNSFLAPAAAENGSKESAYATAPRDVSSGSNQDSSIHASPSEAPPPSPVVDEPSIPVEAGQHACHLLLYLDLSLLPVWHCQAGSFDLENKE